ncbi:MAG: cytochrome C oxidase subunit IV family protein [Chlamydiae bacterium]|nr:cytochrome C oxidase subunit IV family protein [Chlamydiota bacterium]MBI3265591.1 cytochrome C oxidase subunit IV family protein [Chlamydiota bacterium]
MMDQEKVENFTHPNYVAVWIWLLVLTVLEVCALYLPCAKVVKISALVFLAITKALLVAMYFMHLKFERLVLIAVIVYPVVLSLVLTLLTRLSLKI